MEAAIVGGLALALACLDWRVVRDNVGVPWNGYGALPATLGRTNQAPMRYRVFMPWVLGTVGAIAQRLGLMRAVKAGHYQVAKALVILATGLVGLQVLGLTGAVVLLLLQAVVLEFDYWSSYTETLAVLLIITGTPAGVLTGAVVWGLSRETVAMAPVLAGLVMGWQGAGLALIGPLVAVVVRKVQGPADLYCERWTFRTYNVGDLRTALVRMDTGALLTLAWTLAIMGVTVWGSDRMGPALARTVGLAPVWLLAGWVLARVRETRVMLPSAVWLAAWMASWVV